MEAFGEKLMASGLVINDEIQWVAFHGMHDFAYMLKLLTGAPMPVSLASFNEGLDNFFRSRLDLKWHFPKGSLSKLGEMHGLQRHGTAHQGGSDALLTLELFFCLTSTQCSSNHGHLFGLHETISMQDETNCIVPCHEMILALRLSAVRDLKNSKYYIEYAQWIAWGHGLSYEDQYHPTYGIMVSELWTPRMVSQLQQYGIFELARYFIQARTVPGTFDQPWCH
jgi:hypothetical protein